MGDPKRIDICDEGYARSGIAVEYVKRRDALYIHGWYDSYVGIQGREFGLREFLDELGVPDSALRRVLKEREGQA